MCLRFRQAKLELEPAVRLFPRHDAASNQLVQGGVRLHALAAQVPVRQRAHGQQGVPVGRHIGVAGGIPGAYIELGPRVICMITIDHGGWPQVCPGAAVGAFDVDPFHALFHLLHTTYELADQSGYDGDLAVHIAQAAQPSVGTGAAGLTGNKNGVPPVSPAVLQKIEDTV